MPNVFTSMDYNVALTDKLDKAVVQRAQTGFFADNALRAKFIGKKTVAIPEMGMQGLGDYDRDGETGFVRGVMDVSATPHTLQMDRGRSFQIDREDADESGIADLAGQVLAEFVRTKVIPEVDAYVLSKLAGVALLEGQTVTGTPDTEAFKMFKAAVQKARDEAGYDEELVAFVDGTFMGALEATPELSRHLVMNDFKKGELYTKVRSIDGVSILPVESSRMKTAYDFANGGDGEEVGGFTPTDNAKSIGLLIVPKRAASLIKKTTETRTYTPKQNLLADAWKVDYRIYYDVVIKGSLKKGIVAYTY